MTLYRRSRALLVSSLTLAMLLALIPGSHVAAQDLPSDAETDELIAQIEADVVEAEQLLAELRSDRLHPELVVESTGTDPAAILEWVATETRWVPYQGSLRGASGVLMDRTGNSLDRSLLLAELLAAAGHDDARLARATLPMAQAESLARTEVARPAPTGEEIAAPDDPVTTYQNDVLATADELAALVGLDGPLDADADWARAAEAMADHWWVQLDEGSGPVDLDPVLGSDTEGRPASAATFSPSGIPADLDHSLTVRVLIERLDSDGSHEELVLEESVAVAGDRPYRVLELDFDLDPGGVTLPDGADRIEDLAGLPYWRPSLRVDGERTVGEWFSTDGHVEDPGSSLLGDKLETSVSALGGLGDEPEEAPPASELTAVWIEYVVNGPGRAPRVERRELFDILADEAGADDPSALEALAERDMADRGLALLGTTVMLGQGAAIDASAVADAHLRDIIDTRSGAIALAFMAAGREDDRILPSLGVTRPAPLDLMAIALMRDSISVDRAATFLGGANVLSTHVVYDATEGGATSTAMTDIVVNDIDVLPSEDLDLQLARMRQGVLDTLLEHEAHAGAERLNTWARYSERQPDAADWATWSSSADATGATAEVLPAGELARIRSSLGEGYTAVVAPTPAQYGAVPFAEWWRIGPDGSTLGIGYRGWGQDMPVETTQRYSQQELARGVARQRAERICRLWGFGLASVEYFVILKIELRRVGVTDILPRSRSASACFDL